MLQARVRDEAIASAKACSHPEVEKRHVLWALVAVLGDRYPLGFQKDDVRGILSPDGHAHETPIVSADAEEALGLIISDDAAVALATHLFDELVKGGDQSSPASPEGATALARQEAVDAPSSAGPELAQPMEETVGDVLHELDALVGLATVKNSVRRLIALQQMDAARKTAGLSEVRRGQHLVFSGDPGTGKTTVARLLARIYKALGVVSRGHLVETSRVDLVAGYVGQTALKVEQVAMNARGGILFIDEAYALTGVGGLDYGSEAIATLVKIMEDQREDLIVIAAGYTEEMRMFINSNPGLRSRFTH
jgi:hypothetical protein